MPVLPLPLPAHALLHSQVRRAGHPPVPATALQFMRGATTASGLQALRPAFIADSPLLASFAFKAAGPDREHVCVIYTFIVQAVAGFLLPSYFFLCHCSRCQGAWVCWACCPERLLRSPSAAASSCCGALWAGGLLVHSLRALQPPATLSGWLLLLPLPQVGCAACGAQRHSP